MKKALLTLTFALLLPLIALSQEVTTFLGIPIDGTKKEMIKQLKKKYFKKRGYSSDYDLIGEFNGTEVYLIIATARKKVYQIRVYDTDLSRVTAIRRYNELIRLFNENPKYSRNQEHALLPENEDLRYNLDSLQKNYEAVYSQSKTYDPKKLVSFRILRDYSYYRILITYENRYNATKGEDL